MIEVITYVSKQAVPAERWLAYVVMPNSKPWGVRFTGTTEQEAADKARALWLSEVERAKRAGFLGKPEVAIQAKTTKRGQHFKGKVWVIHTKSREKKRIDEKDLKQHLKSGWVRGGPRSK